MDSILDRPAQQVNYTQAASGSSTERSDVQSSEAALVTNTESAYTSNSYITLQAPSLEAFQKSSPVSKRYVLQSVSKEMLGACTLGTNGEKSPFYRLGACSQLSNAFRPGRFEDHGKSKLFFTPTLKKSELNKEFANHFAASLGRYTDDNGISSIHWKDLCFCSSAWICPVCQPKVTEYRAKEVAYAMHQHQSSGGYLAFITFTVPHKRTHSLKQVLDAVTESIRSMKSGRPFQLFSSKHDFVGSIRSLEWTYTERNGHHPHIHELWFFKSKPDVKSIKKWVYERYSYYVVKKHGFDKPSSKRGVDVRLCATDQQLENIYDGCDLNDMLSLSGYITKGADIDKTASEYLNNRQWGAPEELTKSNLKNTKIYRDGTKVQGYNPVSLMLEYMHLQSLIDSGDYPEGRDKQVLLYEMSRFKKLYFEYATFTKGRAMLYWSRGLKDMFGVYDMKDDEVIDQFDSELVEFMSFTLDELQKVVKFRLRAKVLEVAADPSLVTDQQRRDAVKSFISSVEVRSDRFG